MVEEEPNCRGAVGSKMNRLQAIYFLLVLLGIAAYLIHGLVGLARFINDWRIRR